MKRFIFCALIPLTLLSGCSSVGDHIPGWLKPYTPDVHQGNVVTSEMVDALHEGMTKNQVIFLLGTPALRNLFHKEQWNYVYYLKPRFGQTSIRKLEITFDEDGRVESFKSDKMPDETNADLAILGERARESTLKRQEELEKEKQEVQQPASKELSKLRKPSPQKRKRPKLRPLNNLEQKSHIAHGTAKIGAVCFCEIEPGRISGKFRVN